MKKETKNNFLQVADHYPECSNCHPEKLYFNCDLLFKEHGIKCKCICHQPSKEKECKHLNAAGYRWTNDNCLNCGVDLTGHQPTPERCQHGRIVGKTCLDCGGNCFALPSTYKDKQEDWEEENEQSLIHAQCEKQAKDAIDIIKSETIKELKDRLKRELSNNITKLMIKYANTPLDSRGNGWDWLDKARDEVDLLT